MLKIKLKAARINKGLTQQQLANLMGVCRETYAAWENGKRFPDYQQIGKLCETLGLSYDQIDFLP